MVPWSQIARPFSFYFIVNCCKTVVGAGLVGYGFALAVIPDGDEDNGNDNENGGSVGNKTTNDTITLNDNPEAISIVHKTENERTPNGNNNEASTLLIRRYIKVASTIGFGLFLSLPSLTSQIIWESMIPGITATDIAYDLGTENVRGIIPKWNDIIKKPTLSDFGGLIGVKEGLKGLETTTAAVASVRNGGSE